MECETDIWNIVRLCTISRQKTDSVFDHSKHSFDGSMAFLGVVKSSRDSYVLLTIFLTFQNLGSTMVDVVVDAMAAKHERETFVGDLQSLSWSAMAIGGIADSLVGGIALSDLRIDVVFLLFSIFPTIQFLACGLVEEKPSSSYGIVEVNVKVC
jgi:MFS family permease